MSEQITCDNCGVPLFITTTRLVDASGGVVCRGGGAYHDHGGIMGTYGAMGAVYAEAMRAPSARLIPLPAQLEAGRG